MVIHGFSISDARRKVNSFLRYFRVLHKILYTKRRAVHTLEQKGERLMRIISPYDRAAAVRYAHLWAFGRNPRYYDYEEIGGDCTNFASQCIYAGAGVMNFTPTFGWYYIDANDKAPAWTGVEYLYNFLTRRQPSVGPFAREAALREMERGDIVQLSFDGVGWQHTPVVVAVGERRGLSDILVAAHSADADDRPLSTYEFRRIRFLHLLGVYREERGER